MKFRDIFSLKHILFAIVLVALMMLFAINHSNNMVKVKFQEDAVRITSSEYSMTLDYADIASASLEDLFEAGQQKENAYDDEMLRAGVWENDAWGTYYICADLDASLCIVARLHDGRVFVFSRKNNAETQKLYDELLTHINDG